LQATNPNQDSQSTEGQNGLLRYKRSSTAGGRWRERWNRSWIWRNVICSWCSTGSDIDAPVKSIYQEQQTSAGRSARSSLQ